MKRVTIILPVIAMLAACNSQPSVKAENASIAEVAAAAKDAVKLEPGKWETTMTILSIDGPGLPPGMAEAMKQQKTQKVETCLTAQQAEKPPQDMLGAAKNCTYEKFEMGGGKMSGTLVCKPQPGMPTEMRASMSGKFASTSYDITSDMTMTTAGGKMTTKTQVSGKRLGACDAPKAG